MSKRRLAVLAVILAAIAAFFALPPLAEKSLTQTIRTSGFADFTYESSHRKLSGIVLEKVKFDKDGFSTAQSIRADYGLFDLLLNHRVREITFETPSFIGETHKDGSLTIAGFKNTGHLLSSDVEAVSINKGHAEIMTQTLGQISLNYEGQVHHHMDGGINFQGHVSSEQKELSIDARVNAKMRNSGAWETTLDIGQARIDTGTFKTSRASGTMTLKGDHLNLAKFSGQFKAGALSYGTLPWQDIALAVQGTPKKFGISANANATGTDELYGELRLMYENGLQDMECVVKMKSLDTLRAYLKRYQFLTKPPKMPSDTKAVLVIRKILGTRYSYEVADEHGLTLRKGSLMLEPGHDLKENLKPLLSELED